MHINPQSLKMTGPAIEVTEMLLLATMGGECMPHILAESELPLRCMHYLLFKQAQVPQPLFFLPTEERKSTEVETHRRKAMLHCT